jgi:ketosteroid isomerase-like protein
MGANTKVIEAAYDAFGRGDIPALLDLIDEDVEWTSPRTLPQGGEYHGKPEVVRFFENVGAAWDPLTIDVEAIDEVGAELVVGVVRLDGTRRGGKPDGYGSAHVFTVRNGRICRFREYTDLDRPID